MALNTKEKRAAVLGVGRPWMRDKFPVATPDQEWRISSGNAYGGNSIAAAVAVFTEYVTLISDSMRVRLIGDIRRSVLVGESKRDILISDSQRVRLVSDNRRSGLEGD